MNGRNLFETLLAVAGVWLVARQIPDYSTTLYLAATGALPASSAGPSVFSMQVLHIAVSVTTGLALIFSRKILSRWIKTKSSTDDSSADAVFAAGVGILGIYFMLTGLVLVGQLIPWRESIDTQPFIFWNGIASFLIGLSVFVGMPWIVSIWRRVNRTGNSDN